MTRVKKLQARRWKLEDIPSIIVCHKAAYPDYPPSSHYGERIYQMQLEAFPEGQFLVELDGKVVGYATALIVQLDDDFHNYNYDEITGASTFSTHDPSGDSLYGSDIAVHPDYRGRGIAGALYVERKKLLKRYNLRRMIAYGRLPGYNVYAGKLTPEEYVEKVVAKEINDSALNAHLKAGYRVRKILLDFFVDRSSLNYSTFLEMPNPSHKPERRKITAAPLRKPVRKVRVCAAQYQMRPLQNWHEFEKTVEFFAVTADTYLCHYLVLPELFTAQLFSVMAVDLEPKAAARKLAGFANQYLEMLKAMAIRHNLYIVGGSTPIERDNQLYNVAHLFTPTGSVFTQDKLHITPAERKLLDMEPGDGINVFETPFGRIAILLSYDVEFPELVRLLTLAGVEMLFVPFNTDDKKSYTRVRMTAQARAVENYIYVVLAGNVGNLPATKSYMLNYGQSAVFTPCDVPFPLDAVAGEAEPNIEAVAIAELDLNTLEVQREIGTARPLYDRRQDLYVLEAREKIKLIQAE